MKKILVTGIGGNVGQGILRNIKNLSLDIEIIGTDIESVTAGNHLCEKVYKTPYSYENDYIEIIKNICKKENIDLIIPSTDYETYYLSLYRDFLPVLACSKNETSKIFLDKYLTFQNFVKYNIPFAETILPENYKNEFTEIIVKPREGRGSRDLFINPSNPEKFSKEYIIQKLYKGKEITTAFYVTKENHLLGQITLIRFLSSGTTIKCSVTNEFDDKILLIINKIISAFDIKASCNIQAIVSDDKIIPIEVNCRISGTNSIRSQFGFNDLEYIIDEYIFNKIPRKPVIKKGSCIRILMDVIYPDLDLDQISNSKDDFYIY